MDDPISALDMMVGERVFHEYDPMYPLPILIICTCIIILRLVPVQDHIYMFNHDTGASWTT